MNLTKLIALITLFTLSATASALVESSKYETLITQINAREKELAYETLDSIAEDFTTLLETDLEVFHTERRSLLNLMRDKVKNYKGYHWFKKIEKSYQGIYLQKGIDIVLSSQEPEMISIQKKLRNFLSNQSKNLKVYNKLIYNNKSRGSYHAGSKTVSIELLPMDEFVNVLVHEVSHFTDEDLNNTRLNLNRLRVNSENSQKDFGYYWFLRSTYLKSLKEIVPRIDACTAYTSLTNSALLSSSRGRSSERYAEVLIGTKTCQEQVRGELADSPTLSFFWSSGSSEYNLVLAAYKSWHERNNLIFPFLAYE